MDSNHTVTFAGDEQSAAPPYVTLWPRANASSLCSLANARLARHAFRSWTLTLATFVTW